MDQGEAQGPVTVRFDGDIAWVTIDNPPVNATSVAVRAGLMDAVTTTATAGAVVLMCAGRTFVAGADVAEFGKPPVEPHLPDVMDAIESAPVPWVAAIHGTALGGGLELCLACAYRVAAPGAKMGLPEVALGLIPGAGGTVRLPRLIDPVSALEMISGGKPVPAQKALGLGLVDEIAPTAEALTDTAGRIAREAIPAPRPTPLLTRAAPETDARFSEAATRIKRRARGQNSISAAVEAVERSLSMEGPAALAAERAAFLRLKDDPQSIALRHIFFAERAVSKSDRIKGIAPAPLKTIGVVGGGTMGSGIAVACLLSGFDVAMVERDAASAEAAQARVDGMLDEAVKRGKLTEAARGEGAARFHVEPGYEAIGDADLIIEAVFEDMDAKAQVFAQLDRHARPDAILASNTSYLDVAAIAHSTADPGRVIGLHFFSPAHVMKLLEVVVPDGASDIAVATGIALGKRLGKIAVPSGVCEGFIGNRIMSAYRREADYMIEDGALPHEVDAAMRAFGFPIGVFQMQDLAGLDIAWAMRKRRSATRVPGERYVRIADVLCEAGRFGRKTGSGWYDYTDDPKGAVDPAVTAIIEAESARIGIERMPLTADEIMSRILGAMQSEGRAVLAEGIAASAEAIDVVMVNGYAFPRWRGGPMFMAKGNGT